MVKFNQATNKGGDLMKEYIFTTAITLVLAVIGYFLKRTMAKLDSNEERISNVEKNYELPKLTALI